MGEVADLLNNFTEKDKEDLLKEIETTPKKLSVLCAGPTGAGKSTLLNGLIGDVHISDSLLRGTAEVIEKKFVYNGITVTVWDTPGLEGLEAIDENYLKEIKEKCANYDIFLYCIKADESRATELCDENSSLIKFTKLFGLNVWENAVVALTFSNKIEDNLEEEAEVFPDKVIDVEKKFRQRIDEWETKLKEALLQLLDRKVAERVPVLPAGIAWQRDLPGYDLWLSQLFVNFEDRMKKRAKYAYHQIYQHRLKEKIVNTSSEKLPLKDQNLVYKSSFRKKDTDIVGTVSRARVEATTVKSGSDDGAKTASVEAVMGKPKTSTFGSSGLGSPVVKCSSAAATASLIRLYMQEKKRASM